MLAIHPQARTTPAVRAKIACSSGSSGFPTETIRRRRKRGPVERQDRSTRPHKLPWKANDEVRAVVCALRRSTDFPPDDLTFVVGQFLPHLTRNAVYRISKAECLNRLPLAERTRKPHGSFKAYEFGFVHKDVRRLPKLQDRDRFMRKRYLYVAIDRASRYMHLAVIDDETTASASAFLDEALGTSPFRVTHVLTDRSSCFIADAFEAACARHSAQNLKTRPCMPRTNGMVERFGDRLQREVLSIALYNHQDLETLLPGLNRAYHDRRCLLRGLSPEMALRDRPKADLELAKPVTKPPDSDALPKALKVVAAAKEVSRPDA